MKFITILILLLYLSNCSFAQRECLEIEGPSYIMADTLFTVSIDHKCCKCKAGQLSYVINDSTMSDMINIESGKKSSDFELKAPNSVGMHGVYFRYVCEKKMCYGKHMFSVGKPYVKPVKIFEMPEEIKIDEKFIVKLINMRDGEFKLMCESCQSVEYIRGSTYELLISEKGEHMIWIEEKINGNWQETYSRDIIIE